MIHRLNTFRFLCHFMWWQTFLLAQCRCQHTHSKKKKKMKRVCPCEILSSERKRAMSDTFNQILPDSEVVSIKWIELEIGFASTIQVNANYSGKVKYLHSFIHTRSNTTIRIVLMLKLVEPLCKRQTIRNELYLNNQPYLWIYRTLGTNILSNKKAERILYFVSSGYFESLSVGNVILSHFRDSERASERDRRRERENLLKNKVSCLRLYIDITNINEQKIDLCIWWRARHLLSEFDACLIL